jgi:hypothetical protein
VESHERPSGSSRSREEEDVVVREVVVHVDVVVLEASRHVRVRSQKPYRPPIPSRITRQTRFGGNCSRKQSARKACVGNGRKQQHSGRREMSPKQEYLGLRIVHLCLRRVSPYIGAEERRRGNEPGRC